MRRIAAPMVGGMVSSTLLTLFVIPALYALCKQYSINKQSLNSKVKELQFHEEPVECRLLYCPKRQELKTDHLTVFKAQSLTLEF